jgi:lambda family phage portal protein
MFYHILNRHPGDYPFPAYVPKGKRLPAEQIYHTYEVSRPGQTRGESWIAPIATVLAQEKELVDAELTAAKMGAAFAVFLAQVGITDAGSDSLNTGDQSDQNDDNGNAFTRIEAGAIYKGLPGEKPEVIENKRPSQMVAPFREGLRGDLAGGGRIPRRFIDRDVSKANYSSMRCDMIDTKRMLDPVQQWFGRATAGKVYQAILPELCLSAGVVLPDSERDDALAARRYRQYTLLPQGWEYVDPEKDIAAMVDAMTYGLATARDELGSRGRDYRQVLKQNAAERKDFAKANVPYPGGATGADQAKADAVKPQPEKQPQDADV